MFPYKSFTNLNWCTNEVIKAFIHIYNTRTTLVHTFNIFYVRIITASNGFVEYAVMNWKMILVIYALFKLWLQRQNKIAYRE